MNKEQESKGLQPGRFYRFRPTMSQASIIGPYLVDLEGLNIQFFNLKDFSLFKRIQLLTKDEQYCAQIRILSDTILIVRTIDKLLLFNINTMQVCETIKTSAYIEKLQIRQNYIAILSSDEDSQYKIINCWKFNVQEGKIQEKFKSTQFMPIDNQDCTEDNMLMNLIISIDGLPKVYVYWANTVYMIEVDPVKQVSEKYNRYNKIQLSFDLSQENYGQIIGDCIIVNSKKTGKKVAQLMNQGEVFRQVYSDGTADTIYTLSNFGLKKWKLQSNKAPTLYTCPQNIKFSKIFLTPTQLIAVDLQSNSILQYTDHEQYTLHTFPTQSIRKCLQISNNLIFFLLDASVVSFQQDQYQVTKYNKLEIFDFNEDNQIAKKAMLKSQHSVDPESIVIGSQGEGETKTVTIRFIVNEKAEKGEEGEADKLEKKYLLRWTPFQKDQNGKDTKRKQIKGANAYDVVKMYPFNRILGITFAKKSQSFSLFTKQQKKTQLILFDFSTKKIGEYDLQGQLRNIELSQKNQMFTISQNGISIYSIMSEHKNRLEKINELDISALSVTAIDGFLLIQKENCFLLLDEQFECVIKEQYNAEGSKKYKVIKIAENKNKFLLKTQTKLQIWDTAQETTKDLESVPQCEPSLVQYMDRKIVVAGKWVQVYDLKLQ